MSTQTKQEELHRKAEIECEAVFRGSIALKSGKSAEAAAWDIVSIISQEVASVLDEIEKLEVEGMPLSCVVAIQKIKARYEQT